MSFFVDKSALAACAGLFKEADGGFKPTGAGAAPASPALKTDTKGQEVKAAPAQTQAPPSAAQPAAPSFQLPASSGTPWAAGAPWAARGPLAGPQAMAAAFPNAYKNVSNVSNAVDGYGFDMASAFPNAYKNVSNVTEAAGAQSRRWRIRQQGAERLAALSSGQPVPQKPGDFYYNPQLEQPADTPELAARKKENAELDRMLADMRGGGLKAGSDDFKKRLAGTGGPEQASRTA